MYGRKTKTKNEPNYPDEEWKYIDDTDMSYKISNYGRVKSYISNTDKPKILKQCKEQSGHIFTQIIRNNKQTRVYIGKLVAEAFIPNPNNYEHIRYIDGDCKNVKYTNIEWCKIKAFSHKVTVHKYDLEGNYIESFDSNQSVKIASGGKLNIAKMSLINFEEGIISAGFYWLRSNKPPEPVVCVDKINKKLKRISKYTTDGIFVCTFDSLTEAAKSVEGSNYHTVASNISNCLNRKRNIAYNYRWQLA